MSRCCHLSLRRLRPLQTVTTQHAVTAAAAIAQLQVLVYLVQAHRMSATCKGVTERC